MPILADALQDAGCDEALSSTIAAARPHMFAGAGSWTWYSARSSIAPRLTRHRGRCTWAAVQTRIAPGLSGGAGELVVRVRHEVANVAVHEVQESGLHPLFCQRYPTGTCVSGNEGCEAPRDNVASSLTGWSSNARADTATASITAVGNQDRVVWSTRQVLLNVVNRQAKDADRLGPKGTWPGSEAPNSSDADVEPPAERHDLTHAGNRRNVVSPSSSREGKRAAREPTGRRVKDEGASERRPVIGRIGVEPSRRHHPTRKRADFPRVFRHERTWPTDSGSKQICRRRQRLLVRLPTWDGLAFHQLEEGLSQRSSAPGAYREGGSARQMGQGQSSGLPAHPLVLLAGLWPFYESFHNSVRRLRAWTDIIWNTRKKTAALQHAASARLSTPTAPQGVHPQGQQQDASLGHSDDARPGHASVVLAGSGSDRGNAGRPQFLRVSRGPLLCGCTCSSATSCCVATVQPGFSKGTSSRALIGSAMTGYWTHVPMDKVILRQWLKAGFLEKHVLFATTEGTPQGGIISPALANRALDGLEDLLERHYGHPRSRKRNVQGSTGALCG